MRRIFTFKDEPLDPEDPSFNPKMYFKSKYKFKRIDEKFGIEQALDNFESAFKSELQAKSQLRRPLPNLTARQHRVMEQLKDNDDIIVIQADKTGAPVIMDREGQYIKKAFQ